MIDINCHILPGVDDGARTLAESIMMAKEAASQGITKIVATPHHHNGSFENVGPNIIGAVEYLNGQMQRENIPVEILPGQETRVYGDMLADLENGQVIPLNKTSSYVLVELPPQQVPNYTTQLLFDMQIAGYIPVIVHPERNHELADNPDKLYRIVKNGAVTQITAASLLGHHGKKPQRFAKQIIEANLTHVMASDAHNVRKRGFYMREATRYLKKNYGTHVHVQFMENSELMVRGQMINKQPPERIKPKKKWGIFG